MEILTWVSRIKLRNNVINSKELYDKNGTKQFHRQYSSIYLNRMTFRIHEWQNPQMINKSYFFNYRILMRYVEEEDELIHNRCLEGYYYVHLINVCHCLLLSCFLTTERKKILKIFGSVLSLPVFIENIQQW